MYLCLAAATLPDLPTAAVAAAAPPADLDDVLEPARQRLRQLLRDFVRQPVTPRAAQQLEEQVHQAVRDLSRCGVQWAYNQAEPPTAALPSHVVFEAMPYTRLNRKTPQDVATLFGPVRLWRTGYRPTHKTGDPTVFPLAVSLGLVQGATPAVAERVARYQAEAGATQQRTLQRLRQEHGVRWGVKRLRQVTAALAAALDEQRHDVQVARLLALLAQASAGTGPHKPVLSVGRDGITLGLHVPGCDIREVASTATVTVLDRRGRRLGTVYLASVPEPGQGTLSQQLTRLLQAVLQRWEGPLPRLCYVTDAGDNETTYYGAVLRWMRHPRTGARLDWVRVLDYYHASERLWAMADALFGGDARAWAWVRKMQKLLLRPQGVNRVLHSAAALRSRRQLSAARAAAFGKAYRYLRDRRAYLRYAAYRRVGIPLGSGVTEAACKTVYTQRLKLSGMRWKKAGAQVILNLRVLWLSGVWAAASDRVLAATDEVLVPTYATSVLQDVENAA
jgi:hypothetical protein